MLDFVAEAAADEAASVRPKDSLTKLLSLPYETLSDMLKSSALDLKETTWGLSGKRVEDYTLYTGFLGLPSWPLKPTNIGGGLACVIHMWGGLAFVPLVLSWAKHAGDQMLVDNWLRRTKLIDVYEWHGKKYWGAAHGLAGIMHVLMSMQLKPDEVEDVKGTLHYMIKNRFPSCNFPSSEELNQTVLCTGAMVLLELFLTLVRAAEVFGDKEFLQAAIDAGEVVWNRGLLKRVGICHGISGNTYVFLSLSPING
ncbi:hypothetical protein GBA52_013883 [Prunus armeniaca]|nr:hypothetical protein GBA52_013883 [Prunus armeniaca]